MEGDSIYLLARDAFVGWFPLHIVRRVAISKRHFPPYIACGFQWFSMIFIIWNEMIFLLCIYFARLINLWNMVCAFPQFLIRVFEIRCRVCATLKCSNLKDIGGFFVYVKWMKIHFIKMWYLTNAARFIPSRSFHFK